jgi:hypothetical protein
MDTQNNRGDKDENVDETASQARTVSFLREKRSWNSARFRDYFRSPEGKRVGIVALVVLFAAVVLWIVASMSLPGQALYGLKTNVFEPLGGALRWTKENQAAYHVDLMKERFEEVRQLATRESISEGAVAALSNRVNENAEAFQSLTQPSEERALGTRAVIDLTSEFASVASAIEEVAEDAEPLASLADAVADIRRAALSRLDDEIEVYVSIVGDEDLRAFLTEELTEINDRISAENLSEEMTNRVGRSLADVAEAVAANNAVDAIVNIFEAHRLIDSEVYLGPRENLTE